MIESTTTLRRISVNDEQVQRILDAVCEVTDDPFAGGTLLLHIYVLISQQYRSDNPSLETIAAAASKAILSMEVIEGMPQ
jgi:hypothetical protein